MLALSRKYGTTSPLLLRRLRNNKITDCDELTMVVPYRADSGGEIPGFVQCNCNRDSCGNEETV